MLGFVSSQLTSKDDRNRQRRSCRIRSPLSWDFLKKSVGPLKHVHSVPEECYMYILSSINSSVVKWEDDTSAGNKSLRYERQPGMGKRTPQTLCLWNISVLWAGMRFCCYNWMSVILIVSNGQEEIKWVDGILTILNFSHKFFCNHLSLLEPGVRWYLIKYECIYSVF